MARRATFRALDPLPQRDVTRMNRVVKPVGSVKRLERGGRSGSRRSPPPSVPSRHRPTGAAPCSRRGVEGARHQRPGRGEEHGRDPPRIPLPEPELPAGHRRGSRDRRTIRARRAFGSARAADRPAASHGRLEQARPRNDKQCDRDGERREHPDHVLLTHVRNAGGSDGAIEEARDSLLRYVGFSPLLKHGILLVQSSRSS